MSIANDFRNPVALTCMKNLIILIVSSLINLTRIKSNSDVQHQSTKISRRHAVTDTEFSSDDRYVFCRITECLMSNSLTIVKIIPGDNNFMTVRTCNVHNQFLYTLVI